MSTSQDIQAVPASKHTAFQALPIVDISGLFSDDSLVRKEAASRLDLAAREAGFLYLTGHGIARESIDKLVHAAQVFFALPQTEKLNSYIGNSSNHSGYVPMGEEQFVGSEKVDAKEAYDIGFDLEDLSLSKPMLGQNLWPSMEGFQRDVKAYYEQLLVLSKTLFKGFALAFNLPEEYFEQFLQAPANQLRLIHYFFDPAPEQDIPGIGAHTDYEFFTILLPTAEGLQVLNGAGEWIDVPIIDDAFVMNIGDMMELFTNGEYVATSHRVKKISKERYSFPMFCNLDYDTKIEPLPQFCKNGGAKYKPIVCGEHLYAQTIQTFKYLRKRLAKGELNLPEGSLGLASFGHAESIDD
jgi:isopenicillin N synthase-like dioxygenase